MSTHTRLYLLLLLFAAACSNSTTDPLSHSKGAGPAPFDPNEIYAPAIAAGDLSPDITNSLFPAPVGAHWVYEAQTDEGTERIEISVEEETRAVWETAARVIRDTVHVDGELVEDTWDWYGQDSDGNVWYLGEDTAEYENGEVVCHCGAWEAGEDVANIGERALPGVVMLAQPAVGDIYRQEFYRGEAEDVAEVVTLDVAVTVPAGTFSGCLKTRDRSALDANLDEYKYYCPGVGSVLIEEGDVRVELVEYAGLP